MSHNLLKQDEELKQTDDQLQASQSNKLDGLYIYYGTKINSKKAILRRIPLSEVINKIRTGADLKILIDKLRAIAPDDDQTRGALKAGELPYLTFCEFKDNHKTKKNFIRTKYLVYDLDKLADLLHEILSKLQNDPRTFILFVSPSGNGLKLVLELDTEITDGVRYEQLHRYYAKQLETEYGFITDPNTHDPSRACFLSYDPNIYVNTTNQVVSTDVVADSEEVEHKKRKSKKEVLDAVTKFEPGSRNSSLTSMAGKLFAHGIDLKYAFELLKKTNAGLDEPLSDEELKQTVDHVYHDYANHIDFDMDFSTIYAGLKKKQKEHVEIAQTFFTWLKKNQKAEFFTDENNRHYIYMNDRLIEIDEHSADFEALLLKHGGISTANSLGRVVKQVVNASAHIEGKRIKKETWLHTNREKLVVHVNLKNEKNELVRISPEDVTLVRNGNNEDRIFMVNTTEDKFLPVEYIPMDDDRLKEGLELAESHVVRHIPTPEHDRWLSYTWRMSYPLFDLTTSHLITRFQGQKSQGKSTATRVLSYSLYGADYLDKSTVAGLYSDASINPLVLDDNLESRNFYGDPGRADFYLSAAAGGGKQKRDTSGGPSALFKEKSRALILCNGIESIAKSEQTTRMMIIECDRYLYPSDYATDVLVKLDQSRNKILSAEWTITQRVLARMKNGDWGKMQRKLQQEFPLHSKDRMFEHIAIMVLYFEEVWKVLRPGQNVWNLVVEWLKNQEDTASTEIIGTDPIIQALTILCESAIKQRDIKATMTVDDAKDQIRVQNLIKLDVDTLLAKVKANDEEFSCEGTAGELLSAFSTAFQVHLKKNFPIEKAQIFRQRLSNVGDEIRSTGYTITLEEDKHKKQLKYIIKLNLKA